MQTEVTVGVKDLLVARGIGAFGGVNGWVVLIGKSVDNPDTIVCIRKSGGKTPNPKWLVDYPSVQVLVRGNEKGYLEASQKATAVKDALLGLPSQDLNGDRWVQINMIGDIVDMGLDVNKRPMFSVNFSLIIEPAASSASNRTPL